MTGRGSHCGTHRKGSSICFSKCGSNSCPRGRLALWEACTQHIARISCNPVHIPSDRGDTSGSKSSICILYMALLGWNSITSTSRVFYPTQRISKAFQENVEEVYYRMTHAVCRKHEQMLFGWRQGLYLKSKFSLNGWWITCYYSCRGSEFSPQHYARSSKSPVASGLGNLTPSSGSHAHRYPQACVHLYTQAHT